MRGALLVLFLTGCLPDLGPRSAQAHADECATCHPTHAAQFQDAKHADPAASPVFQALRARAEQESGGGAFCDRCHLPDDAFTCLTCHAAAGNQETANGALLADPTGPVRGPWGDTTGPHASAEGALLTDSALCGTCHEVEGFAGFDEHPFRNWEASPAAARGERCQDCHMSPEPGVAAARPSGPVAEDGVVRELSNHAFAGLQTDPMALLERGLTLRVVEGGVEIENHAGHMLPDGAAFTRELWLESREGEVWTGDRRPLHPELYAGGETTWDPVRADRVVPRGVPAGETRFETYDTARVEVCLRFRPVAEALSVGLELPAEDAVVVICATPL